jgi:hypothetical protein
MLPCFVCSRPTDIYCTLLLSIFHFAFVKISLCRLNMPEVHKSRTPVRPGEWILCAGAKYSVGSQYGTCFTSPFWRLEFSDGSYILENLCTPVHMYTLLSSYFATKFRIVDICNCWVTINNHTRRYIVVPSAYLKLMYTRPQWLFSCRLQVES